MTFEEWFDTQLVFICDNYTGDQVMAFMNDAWNAAKEDSKPIVNIEYSHQWDDEWVVKLQGKEVQGAFNFKGAAERWAVENGYRLK